MTQLSRFQTALSATDADAAIISSELNIRYLCGFNFTDGYLLIFSNKAYLLTDFRYIEADGLRIFATHGHHYNQDIPPRMSKGEILIHGHTHILTCQGFDNDNYYLNPGSVAIPKGGNPQSYMVYENRCFTAKDFDGNVIFEMKF